MYHFKTDVGTFWIHMSLPGVYELCLDHQRLGFYQSPTAAALDVSRCNTGHSLWDKKVISGLPLSLDEWEGGVPYIEYEEFEEEENLIYRDALH